MMDSWTLKSCVITASISFSVAAFAAKKCEPLRWVDGDTADFLIDGETVRVRLAGYDTPERGQPFWRVAREAAATAAASGSSCDCYKTDRYRRAVCTVSVDGGRSMAAVMAGAGLACIDARFEGEADQVDRKAARAALAAAQLDQRGIWSLPNPVCAVDFRRAR